MDRRYLRLGYLGDAGDFSVSFNNGTTSTYNTGSGQSPSDFSIGSTMPDGTTVTGVSGVDGGATGTGTTALSFGPTATTGAGGTGSVAGASSQTTAGLFNLGTSLISAGGQVGVAALKGSTPATAARPATVSATSMMPSTSTLLLLAAVAGGIWFLTRKKS